jgi:hypothetical protein
VHFVSFRAQVARQEGLPALSPPWNPLCFLRGPTVIFRDVTLLALVGTLPHAPRLMHG